MIFCYDIGLDSGSMTTNSSAGTEETELTVRAGSGRVTFLSEVQLKGKAVAATVLSGISLRVRRFTTASSGGTAITPAARQTGAPAAKCTAASGSITPGTTDGAVRLSLSCGGSTGNQWIAPNPESMIDAGEAGSGDSLDFLTQGGSASMPHEVSCAVKE